jgi:hypothetical protein
LWILENLRGLGGRGDGHPHYTQAIGCNNSAKILAVIENSQLDIDLIHKNGTLQEGHNGVQKAVVTGRYVYQN